MNWLLVFALVCLLLGFIGGIARMKSLRSSTYPQAEIVWQQDPLSAWRYEPLSMMTLTIHSLGLICLTAVLLFALISNEVLIFPPGPTRAAPFLLALVGIFFTTYASGTAIAYHFVRRWVGPISYGISRDGIFFGKSLIGWKSYSHYETGPDDGQISLYSSYSPSLRTWVLQPSPESFTRVLGLIQENLSPALTIDDSTSWQRSPLVMILEMTALVLGLMLPALWGLMQSLAWVWIYALAAFLLVSILGNRLMTVYDGRGKHPEQKIQTT
jgi:hypothetical protein